MYMNKRIRRYPFPPSFWGNFFFNNYMESLIPSFLFFLAVCYLVNQHHPVFVGKLSLPSLS